ncbi:MAG: hypothetical protein ACLUAR_05765 [Pilosibacter sp.]
MNGQQWAPMCAGFAVAVVLFLVARVFPEEEGHDCPSCSRKAGTQEGKAMAAARGV